MPMLSLEWVHGSTIQLYQTADDSSCEDTFNSSTPLSLKIFKKRVHSKIPDAPMYVISDSNLLDLEWKRCLRKPAHAYVCHGIWFKPHVPQLIQTFGQ